MLFSKIKIIKHEKIDNNLYTQEEIVFKYQKILYSYISLNYKNGPYLDSYQMEIKSLPDYEFIYFEYNDENNKIIKERNYKCFDELFFKELQKCKLINKKYKFTEIGIINKLEYYEEKFKNEENVNIFLYTSGIKKYNRIHDNRKRYLVKINGQFYEIIYDVIKEKTKNVRNDIFEIYQLWNCNYKIMLIQTLRKENNLFIIEKSQFNYKMNFVWGEVTNVDRGEYDKIVEVMNRHFHKHFEKKLIGE